MLALAFLLQAATSASAAPPAKFSILYDPCTAPPAGRDVVVCGNDGTTTDRLPLPRDAPPTPNYVKPDSGDFRDNAMNQRTPCAARQGGCQVGIVHPLFAAAVVGLSEGVKAIRNDAKDRRWAKARARDGKRRQPIDLGAGTAGKLEP